MKRLFESNEEIQGFCVGLSMTHAQYKEAMRSRFTYKKRGTKVKKYPFKNWEGKRVYYPVDFICYDFKGESRRKLIPINFTEDGDWSGILITPEKMQEVYGKGYLKSGDDLDVTITAYFRDLTEEARRAMDQFQKIKELA